MRASSWQYNCYSYCCSTLHVHELLVYLYKVHRLTRRTKPAKNRNIHWAHRAKSKKMCTRVHLRVCLLSRLLVRCIPGITLGKRLPGPPSEWPAPDLSNCWLKGSRRTPLCLLKLGFTYYLWLNYNRSRHNFFFFWQDWNTATGPLEAGDPSCQ